MRSSIDHKEIEQFSQDSSDWWDADGPFKPLHRLNPVRLSYIKEQICEHFGRDIDSLKSYDSLDILDVGCGGGLVCEPLARLGAKVTGADADDNAIEIAKEHAQEMGLDIDYQCDAVENLTQQFDVVLALEIIEHVNNPAEFVKNLKARLKPGGLLICSTLNRSAKSYALGIVAAEHILHWVPKGTHSWKKFVKPSEFVKMARQAGLNNTDITGLIFKPLSNQFSLSKSDLDVNYLITFKA